MKNKLSIIEKITFVIICIIVAYGFFIAGEQHQARQMNNLYPISTKVVSLDYTTDKVTVEQTNGTMWSFTGCDDWQLNDNCNLIMNDNGTVEVYDDFIIDYRYSM